MNDTTHPVDDTDAYYGEDGFGEGDIDMSFLDEKEEK
jgi:hypothetical protein